MLADPVVGRRLRGVCGAVLAFALHAGVPAAESEAPSSFESARAPVALPADWIAGNGEQLVAAFAGRLTVSLADRPTARRTVLEVPGRFTDGTLAGSRLFVVEDGRRVLELDTTPDGPNRSPVALEPTPVGRLLVGVTATHLVVHEDGWGLRLVPLRAHHGSHRTDGADMTDVNDGRLSATHGFLRASWTAAALTVSMDRAWLAVEDGIVEVDLRRPERPRVARTLPWAGTLRDLANDGRRLYALSDDGLKVFDPAGDAAPVSAPAIRGLSLVVAGRTLQVVDGAGRLQTHRERSVVGGSVFAVSVGNNFFSPEALTVDVGDTVVWSNLFGVHNVFSCDGANLGCDGIASNEVFSSGAPRPLWTYSYTFQEPGANRYLCQTHPIQMPGNVFVAGLDGPPPTVPDGRDGEPLRVARLDPAGDTLGLGWDALSCPGAVGYRVLYSFGSRFPRQGQGYRMFDALCDVAPGSSLVWEDVPPATLDSTGLLWFLVVAVDAEGIEGSWGLDSSGAERDGEGLNGASGFCRQAGGKDLSATCRR